VAKWYEILQAHASSDTTKVMLYDDIGCFGTSAKGFARDFDAITSPKIDLHINSYGGEICDGLAIYATIKNHKAEVTVHIDGIAASIASVVALAGDKVCIAKHGFMMIHNGWGMAVGDPDEMRKQADVLDKLCDSIASAYADKTGKKKEEIRAAMAEETWFNAEEAKDFGLADEIEDADDDTAPATAAAVLHAVAKYQKAPPQLRKFAASLQSQGRDQESRTPPKGKERAMAVKFKAGQSNKGVIPCPHCAKEIDVELETPPDAEEAQAKLLAKARDEGVKAERDYRAMFNTVLSTAKLDAVAATDFETQFYGRDEKDLKFLASHAIGQRAQAVGEGGIGNGEGEKAADDAAKADKAIEDEATKRFASESNVRQMFGLSLSTGSDDPAYKSALGRYIAQHRKWAKDEKANGTTVTGAK
jgi:ATP-dependent Clp endopeptidase proteolytic subunit ClpP